MTAKELLDEIEAGLMFHPGRQATSALASRVEKVLALERTSDWGYDNCLAEVLRILNGEEDKG